MISEVDSNLDIDGSGIKIHLGEGAINQKIKNWLKINKGEFWGKPWKGNNLKQFQFLSPTSSTVLSVLEMEISEDLPSQVPIKMLNIICKKATSKDYNFNIYIVYQINESGIPGVYNEDFQKAA